MVKKIKNKKGLIKINRMICGFLLSYKFTLGLIILGYMYTYTCNDKVKSDLLFVLSVCVLTVHIFSLIGLIYNIIRYKKRKEVMEYVWIPDKLE